MKNFNDENLDSMGMYVHNGCIVQPAYSYFSIFSADKNYNNI
jgi:hypothetical protein